MPIGRSLGNEAQYSNYGTASENCLRPYTVMLRRSHLPCPVPSAPVAPGVRLFLEQHCHHTAAAGAGGVLLRLPHGLMVQGTGAETDQGRPGEWRTKGNTGADRSRVRTGKRLAMGST